MKLKQVGSHDGSPSCLGCYYYNIVNTKRVCVRPENEVNCVVGKAGAPRYTIFIEDKETEHEQSN